MSSLLSPQRIQALRVDDPVPLYRIALKELQFSSDKLQQENSSLKAEVQVLKSQLRTAHLSSNPFHSPRSVCGSANCQRNRRYLSPALRGEEMSDEQRVSIVTGRAFECKNWKEHVGEEDSTVRPVCCHAATSTCADNAASCSHQGTQTSSPTLRDTSTEPQRSRSKVRHVAVQHNGSESVAGSRREISGRDRLTSHLMRSLMVLLLQDDFVGGGLPMELSPLVAFDSDDMKRQFEDLQRQIWRLKQRLSAALFHNGAKRAKSAFQDSKKDVALRMELPKEVPPCKGSLSLCNHSACHALGLPMSTVAGVRCSELGHSRVSPVARLARPEGATSALRSSSSHQLSWSTLNGDSELDRYAQWKHDFIGRLECDGLDEVNVEERSDVSA